jgi:hypothetical protein
MTDAPGSPDPIGSAIEHARHALSAADASDPATALPRLREAQELITAAIDEAMAAAVVEGETLRSAGALAGLSENAVGPRLARTRTLAAYQSEEGRVTAAGVERARYDVEQGRHQPLPPGQAPPAPMRFRPRRPSGSPTT